MTFDIPVASDSSSPARPYLPRTQELEKLHYTVGARRRSVADFRGLEPVLPPFFRPRSCTSLRVSRPLTGRTPGFRGFAVVFGCVIAIVNTIATVDVARVSILRNG